MNFAIQALNASVSSAQIAAIDAYAMSEHMRSKSKSAAFYRRFWPWRQGLMARLSDSHRRCFKLALTRPSATGNDSAQWTWAALQSLVNTTLDAIRDWYMLALGTEYACASPVTSNCATG
ncbi:MAG: hypothetical protein ACRD2E_03685 [Terriglobales bacterium]